MGSSVVVSNTMLGDQNELLFQSLAKNPDEQSTDSAKLLAGLNPPQRDATLHLDGPILVLAGAGSGKTRVLTHRVANLILNHGIKPGRVLAVTFTNKASGEMRERLHALLGDAAKRIWISTFHSTALRILRHHANKLSYSNKFVIYDDQDSKGVVKQIVKELSINEEKYPVKSFLRAIDNAKNNLISPEEAAERAHGIESDLQAQVYDRYQRYLLQADAMDFGDLLANVVRLFKEHPEVLAHYRGLLHYLLVDEFQDTNKVQYLFIRMLAEPRRNLFVVGDDDQSIYGFRGASISNILEFERDYKGTKVIKLEQNYRSTATILDAAHAVIEKNKTRKAKKLWTDSDVGDQIKTFIGYDENMEAEFLASEIKKLTSQGMPYNSIGILYRTNAQTRAIEEALVRAKIPYRIFGGLKFFDRKEVKDILAYLRLLANPSDNQAFARIVNTPPRGIGAKALQTISQRADEDTTSFLPAAIELAATHKAVRGFVELIADLKNDLRNLSLSELISTVVHKSGYGPKLAAMKDPTALSRIENLQELEALAATMQGGLENPEDSVNGFLDHIALTSGSDVASSESDEQNEQQKVESVSLMTLHLAKGLEFPVVFLCGLEEGLLPHNRSLDDPAGLEEERRLCYVGITRAKEVLYLTRAYHRGMFTAGGAAGGGPRLVSRFAKDITPKSLLAVGTERSQGASFMEGYPRFSYGDEEELDDNYNQDGFKSFKHKKKKDTGLGTKKNLSLDQIRSMLAPADSMASQPEIPQEYFEKDPAAIEQLASGVRVIHPTFGEGTIQSVSGGNSSATISIQFDSFEAPKKLVYRFAKLVLA